MRVFPAVDILDGQCVQLVQGRRETRTIFGTPLECANRWLSEGADALHVVNLDGAFGKAGKNAALLRDLIRELGVEIQLGGGIRTSMDAESWLDIGVERVILGTAATRDPDLLTIEGWEKSGGDYLTWTSVFEQKGAGSLLYTNVDVEGLQQGVRMEPVERLIRHTSLPVTVAGGVSCPGDVKGLKRAGAYGVVLGSALYSGKIRLQDALEASR
jgi:phosphoribosylformimino-5-aminoimidazole carboxamide ribotide isomerase